MTKESDRKEGEKSITDKLKINQETDQNALNDLTSNDGNEDPGSELDIEFLKTPKDNRNNKENPKKSP